jgi:hypothetical protein
MVLAYGTKKNNFFHPQLLTISQFGMHEVDLIKKIKELKVFSK